jgi:hypothetical protein
MHIVSNRHPKIIFFKLPGQTSYLSVHRVTDAVKKTKNPSIFSETGELGDFFS